MKKNRNHNYHPESINSIILAYFLPMFRLESQKKNVID